jgi:hypothetical protein
VFEFEGRYYRTKGDTVTPLTNFIVKPLEMIESEEETQLTADLVTVRGETFRHSFLTTDFANLQRFKNTLNKRTIALSYTGSEGDLELLKAFISELDWVRKKGVRASARISMADNGSSSAETAPLMAVVIMSTYPTVRAIRAPGQGILDAKR